MKVPRRPPPTSPRLSMVISSVSFGVQIPLTLHEEKSQQTVGTELTEGLLTNHTYKDPISKWGGL